MKKILLYWHQTQLFSFCSLKYMTSSLPPNHNYLRSQKFLTLNKTFLRLHVPLNSHQQLWHLQSSYQSYNSSLHSQFSYEHMKYHLFKKYKDSQLIRKPIYQNVSIQLQNYSKIFFFHFSKELIFDLTKMFQKNWNFSAYSTIIGKLFKSIIRIGSWTSIGMSTGLNLGGMIAAIYTVQSINQFYLQSCKLISHLKSEGQRKLIMELFLNCFITSPSKLSTIIESNLESLLENNLVRNQIDNFVLLLLMEGRTDCEKVLIKLAQTVTKKIKEKIIKQAKLKTLKFTDQAWYILFQQTIREVVQAQNIHSCKDS